MNFIRRLCSSRMVYPYAKFNELSSGGVRKSEGYYIYINVCHDSKRIYFNDSIPECEKKDVLPRVLNTFLGMYPRYVLHSGE
jgi:hypothetical protein